MLQVLGKKVETTLSLCDFSNIEFHGTTCEAPNHTVRKSRNMNRAKIFDMWYINIMEKELKSSKSF